MSDAATGLTTPALVKDFAAITEGSHDEKIKSLIRQATDEIEQGIGRKIIVAEYEEEIDGQSLGPLILKHRPVVNMISLSLNGTEVDESLFTVDLDAGLIFQVSDGATTAWTSGTLDYSANYTSGYEEIPAGLEGIATDIVARRINLIRKGNIGTSSESLGTGGTTEFESREITEAEWKKLRSYGDQF